MDTWESLYTLPCFIVLNSFLGAGHHEETHSDGSKHFIGTILHVSVQGQ